MRGLLYLFIFFVAGMSQGSYLSDFENLSAIETDVCNFIGVCGSSTTHIKSTIIHTSTTTIFSPLQGGTVPTQSVFHSRAPGVPPILPPMNATTRISSYPMVPTGPAFFGTAQTAYNHSMHITAASGINTKPVFPTAPASLPKNSTINLSRSTAPSLHSYTGLQASAPSRTHVWPPIASSKGKTQIGNPSNILLVLNMIAAVALWRAKLL